MRSNHAEMQYVLFHLQVDGHVIFYVDAGHSIRTTDHNVIFHDWDIVFHGFFHDIHTQGFFRSVAPEFRQARHFVLELVIVEIDRYEHHTINDDPCHHHQAQQCFDSAHCKPAYEV